MPDIIPTPTPTEVAERHLDAQVTVRQASEDLTGIPKLDAIIKITKYLGFPIAVAAILLWVFVGLMDEYRSSIKATASAQQVTAEAVVKGTEIQGSTSRALWQLSSGQKEAIAHQEEIQDLLRDMIGEQRKAATALEASIPRAKPETE